MRKKTCWFFMLFFACNGLAFGQTKDLTDVHRIAQEASNLCWAASMEMILKYYDPAYTGTQCEITRDYQEFKGTIANCTFCGDDCEDNQIYSVIPNDCNITIDFTCNYFGYLYPAFSYFDWLFSKYNYNSIEDQNLLTWDQYQDEIDKCRPVILLYDAEGEVTSPGLNDIPIVKTKYFNHAVVAKGYSLDFPDTFMIIHDPWYICDGDSYYLNKKALDGIASSATSTLKVNSILSIVHHIAPKDASCDPCEQLPQEKSLVKSGPGEEDELSALLKKHQGNFIGTAVKSGELNGEFVKEFFSKQHFPTPVEYLSYAYISDNKKEIPLAFTPARVKTNIREITYTGSEPNLVATIRCTENEDFCVVEKIAIRKKEPAVIVRIGNQDILLTNSPQQQEEGGLPVSNFSIVRYPPYPFEFYRFVYKNAGYMVPMDLYSKLYFFGPDRPNTNFAISEEKVLRGLEKYTLDFSKSQEKGERYTKKFERIINSGGYIKINKFLKQ